MACNTAAPPTQGMYVPAPEMSLEIDIALVYPLTSGALATHRPPSSARGCLSCLGTSSGPQPRSVAHDFPRPLASLYMKPITCVCVFTKLDVEFSVAAYTRTRGLLAATREMPSDNDEGLMWFQLAELLDCRPQWAPQTQLLLRASTPPLSTQAPPSHPKRDDAFVQTRGAFRLTYTANPHQSQPALPLNHECRIACLWCGCPHQSTSRPCSEDCSRVSANKHA